MTNLITKYYESNYLFNQISLLIGLKQCLHEYTLHVFHLMSKLQKNPTRLDRLKNWNNTRKNKVITENLDYWIKCILQALKNVNIIALKYDNPTIEIKNISPRTRYLLHLDQVKETIQYSVIVNLLGEINECTTFTLDQKHNLTIKEIWTHLTKIYNDREQPDKDLTDETIQVILTDARHIRELIKPDIDFTKNSCAKGSNENFNTGVSV